MWKIHWKQKKQGGGHIFESGCGRGIPIFRDQDENLSEPTEFLDNVWNPSLHQFC